MAECNVFSSVGNSWFRDLFITAVSEKKTPQSSVKMWFNTYLALKVTVF